MHDLKAWMGEATTPKTHKYESSLGKWKVFNKTIIQVNEDYMLYLDRTFLISQSLQLFSLLFGLYQINRTKCHLRNYITRFQWWKSTILYPKPEKSFVVTRGSPPSTPTPLWWKKEIICYEKGFVMNVKKISFETTTNFDMKNMLIKKNKPTHKKTF